MNAQIGTRTELPAAGQEADLLDPVMLALIEIIREGLLQAGHVRLFNFGTFRVRWVREHRIKHPQSGKPLLVPAHPKVTFTPAQALRSLVEPDPRPVVPMAVVQPPSDQTAQAQAAHSSAMSNPVSTVSAAMAAALNEDYTQLDRAPKRLLAIEHPKTWAALAAALPLILMALTVDLSGQDVGMSALASGTTVPVATRNAQHQFPNKSAITASAGDAGVPRHSVLHAGDEFAPSVSTPATPDSNYFDGLEKYQVQAGDSLWGLAKQFYGDPMLWPLIYRANAASMRHPDRLQREFLLTIPPLQRAVAQLAPTDHQRTAQGYMMVYQYYRQRGAPNAYYFLIGARRYDAVWLRQQRDLVREEHRVYLD